MFKKLHDLERDAFDSRSSVHYKVIKGKNKWVAYARIGSFITSPFDPVRENSDLWWAFGETEDEALKAIMAEMKEVLEPIEEVK